MCRIRVPFIPSPYRVVREALNIAKINGDDVLYDLGAGDGRVVLEAARLGAYGVAVEIDPALASLIRIRSEELGLSNRITAIEDDFFNVYLGDATIIYQYLYPSISEELKHKYVKELRIGTRIIAYNLPISGWTPIIIRRLIDEYGRISTIYLYIRGISEEESLILRRKTIVPRIVANVMGIGNYRGKNKDME
jgi:16S rRNA A1518/A1519 N6-dimethyltransferase RsmA/KsgA/DIM1 with predicted DNA glycosylase/AP lyase activity